MFERVRLTIESNQGFTMLEVTTAVVIFGIVSVIALRLLGTADGIHGRGTMVRLATELASKEAERVKLHSMDIVKLRDTSYEEQSEGWAFIVERHVTNDSLALLSDPDTALTEMKIEVSCPAKSFHQTFYMLEDSLP